MKSIHPFAIMEPTIRIFLVRCQWFTISWNLVNVGLRLCVIYICCNQKERVRKHTAHWSPSTNPGAHVLLIYSTQFRPLITHNTFHCLLTFSNEHYKIKNVQILCSHTTIEQILQYPSPASAIHTDANQGNSLITLQTIYIPRKHELAFHQMFTKTPDSQCCLLSLSLLFLCSNLTDYQARRKVLAFSQAILANRASYRYHYNDRLFSLLKTPPISSSSPSKIILPSHIRPPDFLT
jgi:hypothetical protein